MLTGTLDDGTAGLQAIKMRGGQALVQDPDEALFVSMPHNAIENVAVDFVQPLAGLAETLVRLTQETPAAPGAVMRVEQADDGPSYLEIETEVAELDMAALEAPRAGKPSGFSCPDCHGVLWELQEGDLVRFRCRVGHAYSPESLLASQSENLEEALWMARRTLEASAAMAARLQERAQGRGHVHAAQRFGEQADDARHRAEVVRQALTGGQSIANPGPPISEENARSAPFAPVPTESDSVL